ncbi:MAG: protein of unknown function transrane [Chloroflexi bacterium]|nr:protein of unknown function transrane [Chloroflexota bacterium]
MPEVVLPASLAVVVLGLIASVTWGASDFAGGWLSRRAPLIGVLLGTQGIGLLVALAAAAVRDEPALRPEDVGWAALSGILASAGFAGLYGGLALGRMGIVAPVTGLIVVATPVIAGAILEGLPGPLTLVGIGLAGVAVVVVSLAPDDGSGRPIGLRYALVAGVGLGLTSVTISRLTDGAVFGPLVVMRGVETVLFVSFILVRRSPWRIGRPIWPWLLGAGALDLVGNASFIAATQTGALAVAAVLSSMYPVVTVILAALVLREKMTRSHGVGLILAAIAIGLIVAGTRGQAV